MAISQSFQRQPSIFEMRVHRSFSFFSHADQRVTKTLMEGKGNECMEALAYPIEANIFFRAPMIVRQKANRRCNSCDTCRRKTSSSSDRKSKQVISNLIAEDVGRETTATDIVQLTSANESIWRRIGGGS